MMKCKLTFLTIVVTLVLIGCVQRQFVASTPRVDESRSAALREQNNSWNKAIQGCLGRTKKDPAVQLVNAEILYEAGNSLNKDALISSNKKITNNQKNALSKYLLLIQNCREIDLQYKNIFPSRVGILTSYYKDMDVIYAKLFAETITIGQANSFKLSRLAKLDIDLAHNEKNLYKNVDKSALRPTSPPDNLEAIDLNDKINSSYKMNYVNYDIFDGKYISFSSYQNDFKNPHCPSGRSCTAIKISYNLKTLGGVGDCVVSRFVIDVSAVIYIKKLNYQNQRIDKLFTPYYEVVTKHEFEHYNLYKSSLNKLYDDVIGLEGNSCSEIREQVDALKEKYKKSLRIANDDLDKDYKEGRLGSSVYPKRNEFESSIR